MNYAPIENYQIAYESAKRNSRPVVENPSSKKRGNKLSRIATL